jgi:O-antigen/teichoic acid export membrane protein
VATWANRVRKTFNNNSGIAYVAIGTAGSAILGGIFWIVFAYVLGAGQYGEIAFLLSIGTLLGTAFSFGGNTSLTSAVARGDDRVMPAVHAIVFLFILPANIAIYFFSGEAALNVFFTGLVFYLISEGIVLGGRDYRKYARFLIAQKLVAIAASFAAYYLLGIQGIVLGYGFSTLAFSYPFFQSLKKFGMSYLSLKENIAPLMHNYSVEISRIVTSFADKIFIGPIFGYLSLGYYQLGAQILVMLGMFPLVFYSFNLAEQSSGRAGSAFNRKGMLASVAAVALYILAAPFVLPVVLPNFSESLVPSQIMSIGAIPMAISYSSTSTLIARGKTSYVFITATLYIAVQLALFYLLGSLFGLIGLAAALPVSLAAQATYYVWAQRRIKGTEAGAK